MTLSSHHRAFTGTNRGDTSGHSRREGASIRDLRPRSGYSRLLDLLDMELSPSGGASEEWAAERARCAGDVVYWLDTYGYTYDPRTPAKALRFTLFPRQADFLRWIGEREAKQESGLCEKSRGVGVSFLCAAHALHGWLFRPGYKVGFGSQKLELVDKLGDLNSIFEKIRFMMRRLPGWMLPRGFRPNAHDCHTKIINPDTEAAITGEGGDELGRGGRVSLYFIDEAARIPNPHLVEASLVETTNVRIDVSTPNGPGNPFAVKRFGLPPERVFTFHWTDDPRKNMWVVRDPDNESGSPLLSGRGLFSRPDGLASLCPALLALPEEKRERCLVVYPWAETVKAEKGETVFAAEYDIDYSASVEGIVIPGAWVRAAVEVDLPGRPRLTWVGCAGASGSNGVTGRHVGGLDIGEEGADLSVLIPRRGPVVGHPVSWAKYNTTATAWRARDEAVKLGLVEVCYDVVGIGAGVKGTWNTSERPLTFRARPVNTGEGPTEAVWPDGQTSREKFINLRAELWWSLRRRFERTYELVTQGVSHPAEDMISIPNHPQLIADLSLPLHFHTETGKIKIESKEAMARRGIKSPDFADALVLSEASCVVRVKEFWIR